jgi:hypothetical protein
MGVSIVKRLRRGADHVPHALHMDDGGCDFLREIAAAGARLPDCAARHARDVVGDERRKIPCIAASGQAPPAGAA